MSRQRSTIPEGKIPGPETKQSESIEFRPVMRCFSCNTIDNPRLKHRVINGKLGLSICPKCDSEKPEKQNNHPIVTPQKHIQIEPEHAQCHVCSKPIIDGHKIKRRIKKLTSSGSITETDKKRIAAEERKRGWSYIGNNVYVHTRCKR